MSTDYDQVSTGMHLYKDHPASTEQPYCILRGNSLNSRLIFSGAGEIRSRLCTISEPAQEDRPPGSPRSVAGRLLI